MTTKTTIIERLDRAVSIASDLGISHAVSSTSDRARRNLDVGNLGFASNDVSEIFDHIARYRDYQTSIDE